MDLADVMDELAARLATLNDLGRRVHAQPPQTIAPPAAIVSYPESTTFDETYGRGMDRMRIPVVLVVGKVVDRAARDQLGAYCDGTGDLSVKQHLESGTYAAFDSLRVESIEFDPVTISAVDYMAAVFTVDIVGTGSN